MFIQYGNYVHQLNEAAVTISRVPRFNEGGIQTSYVETWQIRGVLQAASVTALTTAIQLLQAAYSLQGRNIGLFEDSGTATAHGLISANTIGGVRVISGPDFPEGEGAEYSTFRTYQIALEAEVPNVAVDLIFFTETLAFTGGGPRFVFQQPLNGLPQRQRVADSTPFVAQQVGNAIGYFQYPAPSGPIFTADEHIDQRRIEYGQPKRTGAGFTEFPISWSYTFESAGALNGLPRLWPLI